MALSAVLFGRKQIAEAISMVNAAKTRFSKRSRATPDSTLSVDTQIDVKPPQVSSETADSYPSKEERPFSKKSVLAKNSRKEVSSVPRLLSGIQQETPTNGNLKALSVSSRKHNLTFQVVDNPPDSYRFLRNCGCES
ncbi:unnamed protein product [Schistosoma curassoni]|uniref:Uncharacterized protein n=1 Tax=Schistosoma curassoni TaxID=6186 RepID=A0A183KQ81_9TREM|nr:unnamed protein product [Schistosoma curassoni]